jgi:glycosyltransferase involved in cell wall biosynthesis
VASDLPALREVLRDGENALLVEPGHAPAFAEAIRRLVGNEGLAHSLASAALADVREYTWDRRAERLEALFTTVHARGARPEART